MHEKDILPFKGHVVYTACPFYFKNNIYQLIKKQNG